MESSLVLVDTSVWIDHLKVPKLRLTGLLETGLVYSHPFVVGELACGNLADRAHRLYLLRSLPQAPVASDPEILFFIEKHGIHGRGVGYLDMHLLVSAALGNLKIWTLDRRLGEVALGLGLYGSATFSS